MWNYSILSQFCLITLQGNVCVCVCVHTPGEVDSFNTHTLFSINWCSYLPYLMEIC